MKKRFIRYLFVGVLITIILVVFIGLIYIIFHDAFGYSKTITASIIAFTGALLGGGLTLLGVLLTIKANQRLRDKEELPKKIYHLESAIELIQKTINEDLSFKIHDIYDIQNNFIQINNILYLEFKGNHEHIVKVIPKQIRDYLTFVDSESYKKALIFNRDILLLESILSDVHDKLHNFKEDKKMMISLDANGEKVIRKHIAANQYKIYYNINDMQYKTLNDIKSFVHKKDREYTNALTKEYESIWFGLLEKRNELLKKISY